MRTVRASFLALFARWDGSRARINFEATSPGFNTQPDDHYRKWPQPLTDRMIADGYYLKSQSPKEELMTFLNMRGIALLFANRVDEALAVFSAAEKMAPGLRYEQKFLQYFRQQIQDYRTQQATRSLSDMEAAAQKAILEGRRRRGDWSAGMTPLDAKSIVPVPPIPLPAGNRFTPLNQSDMR